MGAGNYYLATNPDGTDATGFRNQGQATIDTTLANDLKSKTTYPPVAYTGTAATLSSRNLGDVDTPDLGYHYTPLDYTISGINGLFTFTDGVAIGIRGASGFYGGTIVSVGSPKKRNQFAVYTSVQEQSMAWGGNISATYLFNSWAAGTQFQFTDISLGGSAGFSASASANLSISDCLLHGVKFIYSSGNGGTLRFTNNIIERCYLQFLYCGGPYWGEFYNNLFLNTGNFGIGHACGAFAQNFIVKNNLFAGSSFTYGAGTPPAIFNNGFFNSTVTSYGSNPVLISAPLDFVSGPLGPYYYPTMGDHLNLLINAGIGTAVQAGLYHYTTTANQTKEASSQVDIGFHYVAVDSNENPVDTDDDGFPDYAEDRNGNGLIDAGENPWAATVSVQSATYPVAWESDEDPGVFTVTRVTDNLAVPLNVNIQVSGSAIEGTDYPPIGSQVTIPAGATSESVYLWPFSDGIGERTASMTLLASDNYIVGTPNNATVSIHDGTPPPLVDPKTPGSFSFSSVVYATDGVQKIELYQTPCPSYTIDEERRLDISPFYWSIDEGYWGFNETSVPINGILRVPSGTGPFPLAIFVHGNHLRDQYSDPGYVYLCELLASHGILAATIDENFLNQSGGELPARAIVHLEHVRQFVLWNATPSHPLYGKVDMNQIMLIGHSRGGEGVGRAGYYNTYSGNDPVPLDGSAGLGPYAFQLKALVAISPTDPTLWGDVPNPIMENYFIIHGSRDADVLDFQGYKTYDRAHPIDPANPLRAAEGFKALAWIIGANHNFFNSTWDNENFASPLLTRQEQESVAKVYVSAMAKAMLLGQRQYLKFLKNHNLGSSWLPPSSAYVSQYQAANRLFINHYEEDSTPESLSPPSTGVNTWSGTADFSEMFLDNLWWLHQETFGVRFGWSAPGDFYEASFSGSGLDAGRYGHLALRIGQSDETGNPLGQEQDLRIIVQDNNGVSASFVASSYSQLLYPDAWIHPQDPLPIRKTVMQTVRVPINVIRLAGVDVNHIAFVKLVFDQVGNGIVYFDDIQLSN